MKITHITIMAKVISGNNAIEPCIPPGTSEKIDTSTNRKIAYNEVNTIAIIGTDAFFVFILIADKIIAGKPVMMVPQRKTIKPITKPKASFPSPSLHPVSKRDKSINIGRIFEYCDFMAQ
jgi:hypothetical protein